MSVQKFLDTWIRDKVSQPSPETANIPACPYALKAWVEDKVKIVEVANLWEEVAEQIEAFTDDYQVVICSQIQQLTYEELEGCCMGLNAYLALKEKDIWLLSFQDIYDMILIQRLSHLDDASKYLERLNYYANYGRDDFERLILTRRKWRERCPVKKV